MRRMLRAGSTRESSRGERLSHDYIYVKKSFFYERFLYINVEGFLYIKVVVRRETSRDYFYEGFLYIKVVVGRETFRDYFYEGIWS